MSLNQCDRVAHCQFDYNHQGPCSMDVDLERLKRGDFTTDEFQNLCHNLPETCTPESFAEGCVAYQRKLFGRAPREDKLEALRADLARVSEEMGLPPDLGPARGELKRLLSYARDEQHDHARTLDALRRLRIDANRLADRNLGGTYEQDVRASIAVADVVLKG